MNGVLKIPNQYFDIVNRMHLLAIAFHIRSFKARNAILGGIESIREIKTVANVLSTMV